MPIAFGSSLGLLVYEVVYELFWCIFLLVPSFHRSLYGMDFVNILFFLCVSCLRIGDPVLNVGIGNLGWN